MAEIPSDVHPSIMKALPSKSLIKFLSVSKRWYSIIKSPYFLASYRNHHKSASASANNDVFLLKAQSRYYIFRYRNPHGSRRTKVSSPPPSDFDRISASLDGLLCLSGAHHPNLLLLWNPSLNKFKKVATPSTPGFRHVVGLASCCNHVQDDYRIVVITFTEMNLNLWSGGNEEYTYTPPYAQVYSLTNPSSVWKSVALPWFGNYSVSRISQGCSVNDTVHWIIFRGEYDDELFGLKEFGASVLTYNANNDCFAEMKLPMELEQVLNPDLTLSVIGDSLCVVHFPGGEQEFQPSAVVWGMEAYGLESWKVLYKVKLSSVSNGELWALEDGKIFITTTSGKLIVINVQRGTSVYGEYDGHVGMTGGQAFPYTETLVLMDGIQREQLEAN